MQETALPSEDQPDSSRRAAVRLLESAGASLGIRVETYCHDWVIRLLHPGGRTRLVWGYNFDLNPSAAAHIAKDKPATWEVLRAAGVAAVEHRLFLRADLEGYAPEAGNWRDMLAAFEAFRRDAVIKPTDGIPSYALEPNRLTLLLSEDGRIVDGAWD